MLYIINGLIDKPQFVIEVMRNSICQLWIHHQSVNNQTVTVARTVTHHICLTAHFPGFVTGTSIKNDWAKLVL